NGGCATNWPPALANDDATATRPFSFVDRDDGTRQWALRGMPLYFFANDNAAGDINGEGPVWHVALAQPVSIRNTDDSDFLAATGRVAVAVGSELEWQNKEG